MVERGRTALDSGRFQFSLGTLMLAMLYAAGLATLTVNLAGKQWQPAQIAVAYLVTIAFVVGFAVLSRACGKIDAYLLLSPLVFVFSVSAASMVKENRSSIPTVQPMPTPTVTIPNH